MERYDITLDSPLGPRSGIMTLAYTGDQVNGILSVLGHDNPFSGTQCGTDQMKGNCGPLCPRRPVNHPAHFYRRPPLWPAHLRDCPHVYGYGSIETPKLNESQIAEQMIGDTFAPTNMVALVTPAGDYDRDRVLLPELARYDEVDYTMALYNVEAMDGYMLADKLPPGSSRSWPT